MRSGVRSWLAMPGLQEFSVRGDADKIEDCNPFGHSGFDSILIPSRDPKGAVLHE